MKHRNALFHTLTQIEKQKEIDVQKEVELKTLEEALELERKAQKEAAVQGLRPYTIKAIEFDWIFDKNYGKKFLSALSKTEHTKIFELQIISDIVLYMWGYYRTQIIFQLLFPFIVYFAVFIMYASWISNRKSIENGSMGDTYYTINFIFLMFIIVMLIWNGYFNIRKLIYYKHKFFKSFWNWVDIGSFVLNLIVIIMDLKDKSYSKIVPVLSLATLLMYVKLIYFGRISRKTAWMVRMIYSVTIDIRYYLFIFVIMVLGFSNSFYIINKNGDHINGYNSDGFYGYTGNNKIFTHGDTFGFAIVYAYKAALGMSYFV